MRSHECETAALSASQILTLSYLFHLFWTVPEADGVPVTVEGLEVLLIVDPLFASRTNGQTSPSCNDSNTKCKRWYCTVRTQCPGFMAHYTGNQNQVVWWNELIAMCLHVILSCLQCISPVLVNNPHDPQRLWNPSLVAHQQNYMNIRSFSLYVGVQRAVLMSITQQGCNHWRVLFCRIRVTYFI